jgi:hypothetical protein
MSCRFSPEQNWREGPRFDVDLQISSLLVDDGDGKNVQEIPEINFVIVIITDNQIYFIKSILVQSRNSKYKLSSQLLAS